MKIKLIHKKQNEILGAYTVGLELFTIGRDPQNALVLSEPHISRIHAQLEWKKDKLILTKTSPTGKLIFDGKNIETQEFSLAPGSFSFEIPPYSFTLSLESEESAKEEIVVDEPPFPFMISEEIQEEEKREKEAVSI